MYLLVNLFLWARWKIKEIAFSISEGRRTAGSRQYDGLKVGEQIKVKHIIHSSDKPGNKELCGLLKKKKNCARTINVA